MAFNRPKINKIDVDIKNLTIYIRTIKKFGKSTLFRDIILEKYKDASRGLLVGIGAEWGYTLLDDLNHTHIETWKDLMDMKKWLIEEKGKEHNIEMICFDVVDELFPIIEKEVIRLSVIDTKKPCKSINSAFGGYGAGGAMVVQMAKEFFLELKKAGFGVWTIAHTKYKSIKEKGDIEDGYMSLTSSLASNYEGVFGDVFDCVLTGLIDRDIDKQVVSINDDGTEKIKKTATSETRKLYLRGTTFVDAGCRFTDGSVPDYIEFNEPNMANIFIKVIEEGMEKSKSCGFKEKVINKVAQEKIHQDEIVEEASELENITQDESIENDIMNEENELIIDQEKNMKLKKEFVPKYKLATPEQKKLVTDTLAKYDTKKLDDKKPTKMFEELLAIFE